VYEIEQTETFVKWLHDLKDDRAKARIRAHIIFLLCGGDKRSQEADIKQAHKLAKENV
jgi:putative component of toxin-antitoxin plasmid stabilization module